MLSRLLLRVRHFLRRREFEDDLAEELAFHHALKQQELEELGQPAKQAASGATRALGSAALARDEARDAWIWPWLADGIRDLRHAVRLLRRDPGFTLVAVLTLALGIGANTAIFSLINALLLRELPVRAPRELRLFGRALSVGSMGSTPSGATDLFSYQFYRDFRRDSDAFESVAAIGSMEYGTNGRVDSGGFERVGVELVSGSYFDTLGLRAAAGRVLADADDRVIGGHPVAVASYSWWQRRFGGAPILGSTVSIGRRTYAIVGVAQAGFSGITVGQSPDLWIPLAMQREISPGWNGLDDPMFQALHMVGRLKAGVPPATAQAATNALFRRLMTDYASSRASATTAADIQRAFVELTPGGSGRSNLRVDFMPPLTVLMAVVGLVLLIACANVANLLLARASARQREIAVRMSLGAGRLRVIRQLLAEGLILAAAGAALGIAFAAGASRLLVAIVSIGSQPLPLVVTPDLSVLTFTLIATLATVMLFGAAPALNATRLDLVPALKDGGTASTTPGRARLSRLLVVGQVALSVTLIAGAMLFLRSLTNVLNIHTGFDKRNVLVIDIDAGGAGYEAGARYKTMLERVEQRVAQIPGVDGAGFALSVFNGGGWSNSEIVIPGRARSADDRSVVLNLVGRQYLDVMRMPIVAGRGLSERDTPSSLKVAVINETMARMYFGEPFPLGRTFSLIDDEKGGDASQWKDVQVVGVARDAKYFTLFERQRPAAFFPHAQHTRFFLSYLAVRHESEEAAVLPAIRRAIADVDPNLPMGRVITLGNLIDFGVVNRRAVAQLSAVFGLLAVLLASIGIYGVTAYGTSRRTNEFGIRMALGADRQHVLWLVLSETTRLGVIGVAVGLLLALAAGRFISSLLFGLSPYDPAAILVAGAAMIGVALVAGYVPARRATRIDPLLALKRE